MWMITGPSEGGVREGSALDRGMQSAGDVGYEHARLKVIEYRAVNGNETDGNILFARVDGKGGMPDLLKDRNYAEHPVKVKAKSGSDMYYVARVQVTGPIKGAFIRHAPAPTPHLSL
ncbi:hypothetical protein ACFYZ5_46985 [Streptomyces chartreusis]|uniref:hypothetical protein n=1 Tax=Streptomyces chartreusis TaxID=1969 RepID=UPI0036BB4285